MINYARKTEDGRLQTLQEHIINVSKYSARWGKSFYASELARVAGAYHDLGKATKQFQKYLFKEKARHGSVPHSIYGAKKVYEDFCDHKPIAEILANVIASHHGSLRDFLSPDGNTKLVAELNQIVSNVNIIDQDDFNREKLDLEFKTILKSFPDKEFGVTMLIKLLFSCVVDADRFDAYLFERNEKYTPNRPNWNRMSKRLNKYLRLLKSNKKSKINSDSEITKLRNSVSSQCAISGKRTLGIYKLEVPTGGGKTLSSLRFAIEHAREHKLDRIIYVAPYLSILSQTANEIRKALNVNDDIVLEHHSNLLPDDIKFYKLHTDRWDYPIVLTTQVQFLESVFSAKASKLRKLHSITNSVIVFDEIQTLPIKCVHLFNAAMNFFNSACGSTVLLCTATQPLLDKVKRPILMTQYPQIAICGKIPRRTEIINKIIHGGYSIEKLAEFILQKHCIATLVIVNTKAAAKSLYQQIILQNENVMHLSTNMCSAHRDSVFTELREKLRKREEIICVSTQLIEAGVDISFECVIRDIAGFDSILQAAGRCNRHNDYGEVKGVYVINIADENLNMLPDIKIGANITRRLFDENNLSIDQYYKHYFYERKDLMDYPTRDGGTIYDLITKNRQGIIAYCNHEGNKKSPTVLTSAIKSATEEFYIIAPGQAEVVVPYKGSEELLLQYHSENDLQLKHKILQQLGRYSVSLYGFQLDELYKRGALCSDDGISILTNGFYDENLGIDITGCHNFLNV